MDENVYQELINEIKMKSVEVDGIEGTEKCFVRKSGSKYHVDLHAMISGKLTVTEGHDTAHRLKDYLRHHIPNLRHVLIHVERFKEKNKPY